MEFECKYIKVGTRHLCLICALNIELKSTNKGGFIIFCLISKIVIGLVIETGIKIVIDRHGYKNRYKKSIGGKQKYHCDTVCWQASSSRVAHTRS